MSAGPFRHLIGRALHAGVDRVLVRQAPQHAGHRTRIVSCTLQVGHAQVVRFGFLPARILQRKQLATGREYLLANLPECAIAEQRTRQQSAQCTDDRISG